MKVKISRDVAVEPSHIESVKLASGIVYLRGQDCSYISDYSFEETIKLLNQKEE
jgi:hypothetical protein